MASDGSILTGPLNGESPMEDTQVRPSRPGARAVVALLLTVAGFTGACGGADAGSPAPDEDIAGACAVRATANPASFPSGESCEAIVRRLNGVLADALSGRLPKSAVLTNNLFGMDQRPVGGAGMTFVARRAETGGIAYEAPVRIREADRSASLRVEVGFYDTAPFGALCPDQARADDMKLKGMMMHRCDRTVDAEGTVILVNDESHPYGSGEWAKVLLRAYVVTAYRKDGVQVRVALEPVVERAPDPATVVAGDQPTMLALEQVRAIALDRGFTLTR